MAITVTVTKLTENTSKVKKGDDVIVPIKQIHWDGNLMYFVNGDKKIITTYEDIADKHGTVDAEGLLDFYAQNGYFRVAGGGVALPISQSDVDGLEPRLSEIEGTKLRVIWYEEIILNASPDGQAFTVTPPAGGSIINEGFGTGLTAIVKAIDAGGQPTDDDVLDNDPNTEEDVLAATLDALGNGTILGNCDISKYPSVAVIYNYEVSLADYDSTKQLTSAERTEGQKVPSSIIYVTKLSDLPAPVAGKIVLDDNRTYILRGVINIGANSIVIGQSSTLMGYDKSDDGFVYTGTGSMLEIVNKTVSVVNLFLATASATAIICDVQNTTQYSFQIRECIFTGGQAGRVIGGNLIIVNNNVHATTLANGWDISGTVLKLGVDTNFFENTNASFHVYINNGTFDVIKVIDNDFSITSPNTAVEVDNVTITSIGAGSIVSNSFKGDGTFILGVTDDTLDWIIEANGSEVLSTSQRIFIRKIRNEEQLRLFLLLPDVSDYVYEIDGKIEFTQPITVPATGLTFNGYGNNFSTMAVGIDNMTLFEGGGNLFINDMKIEANGTGRRVFNLTDPINDNAVEFVNVNFENVNDIGILDSYRQGLLINGFFLNVTSGYKFQGTWSGGFRIDASLALLFSIDSLFKSEVGHSFAGRFVSNLNSIATGTSIVYDFREDTFVNDGDFQLNEANFRGGGNYINGITRQSIKSFWKDNIGIQNTFQGVVYSNATSQTTIINATQVYVELVADIDVVEETWFTSQSSTSFDAQYDSSLQIDVAIELFIALSSSNNREFEIDIRNYRTSLAGGFDSLGTFKLTTNGGVLGNRVESTSLKVFDTLDQGDRIRIFIRNNTANNDVSLDASSKLIITQR